MVLLRSTQSESTLGPAARHCSIIDIVLVRYAVNRFYPHRHLRVGRFEAGSEKWCSRRREVEDLCSMRLRPLASPPHLHLPCQRRLFECAVATTSRRRASTGDVTNQLTSEAVHRRLPMQPNVHMSRVANALFAPNQPIRAIRTCIAPDSLVITSLRPYSGLYASVALHGHHPGSPHFPTRSSSVAPPATFCVAPKHTVHHMVFLFVPPPSPAFLRVRKTLCFAGGRWR